MCCGLREVHLTDSKLIYSPDQYFFSARSFGEKPQPKVKFYVKPYVPVGGSITSSLVFIYGRFGTWKTPIVLQLLNAIARGEDKWGLTVSQAEPLLFIQADMPEPLFHERWTNLEMTQLDSKVWTYIAPTNLDIVNITADTPGAIHARNIIEKHRNHRFKVVAIDCLQTIQPLNILHQETVQIVYGALKSYFHGATVILIHHERKRNQDPKALEDDAEAFAGSQAWSSQAQIGIRVKVVNRAKNLVRLVHTKSHAGKEADDLELKFDDETQVGYLSGAVTRAQVEEAIEKYKQLCLDEGIEVEAHATDVWVSKHLACGEATARRRRLDIGADKAGS